MKIGIFTFIFTSFLICIPVHALDINADIYKEMEKEQEELLKRLLKDPTRVEEVKQFFRDAKKKRKAQQPQLLQEESVSAFEKDCTHCPQHVKLAGTINQVLDELKKNPEYANNDELPIDINRLKFLFYSVKSRLEDGTITCTRYKDLTPRLTPTKFDGKMELQIENVFEFGQVSAAQILTPGNEEVIYYYRGEGDQKNIIVQVILTKEGGKFRYYYYRPTEKEKNPYNLPDLGEDIKDPTVGPKNKSVAKKSDDEDKKAKGANFEFTSKLETEEGAWLPTNYYIGQGEINQNISLAGLNLSADTTMSIRGHKTNFQVKQGLDGEKFIEMELYTSAGGGKTTVAIPYEITLGKSEKSEGVKVAARLEDTLDEQVVTLNLSNSYTQFLRSEYRKDRDSDVDTYSVAKDFSLGKGKKEVITIGAGKNDKRVEYLILQYRKAVKDRLTMVLDVRLDDNDDASFAYQLESRF